MAILPHLFTDNQRDTLALVGFGLAIIQTLLAIYSFIGPIRIRTQLEVDRAIATRKRLVNMLLIFICSELVIVIIAAALWIDGGNWRTFVILATYVQVITLVFVGLVVLGKSGYSISVVLLYSMLLTVLLTMSIRYRIPPDELSKLDIHEFSNIFRIQIEPLASAFLMLSAWSFLRYWINLTRLFYHDVLDTPVDNSH